jgi:hypothetical protein
VHRDAPDLGEDQATVVQSRATMLTEVLVGETGVAVGAVKTKVTRRLSRFHAGKKLLERSVEPSERVLQNLRMDVVVCRSRLFDRWELGALLRDSDTHEALAPGLFAFQQRGVVEFTAAACDKRQRLFLFRRRLEFVCVGFAHSLLVPIALFCLIAR